MNIYAFVFKMLTVRLLALWTLSAMLRLAPSSPYKNTYQHTADVFAKKATDAPLFPGDDGPRRTVAFYLGVSWFESNFDPKAKGDGVCLESKKVCKDVAKPGDHENIECSAVCTKKGPPQSFCLGQINSSNFSWLGVTEETLLEGEKNGDGSVKRTGTEVCVAAMHTMMKRSLQICASRPLEDRLGWYAAGGDGCVRGFQASGNRVRKAQWLFNNIPLPEQAPDAAASF